MRDQGGGLRVRAKAVTANQSSACECEKDNPVCVETKDSGACVESGAGWSVSNKAVVRVGAEAAIA